MTEENFLSAKFSRGQGLTSARFEVTLDAAPAQVWAFLTESELMPQWLAPGTIELRAGGAAKLDFQDSGIVIDSHVTRCEAPSRLDYSWSAPGQPDRPIRWMLSAQGAETLLALELDVPDGEDAARSAAGWAAHLEMLAGAMAGAPMKFPFLTFKGAREAYKAQIAQLG